MRTYGGRMIDKKVRSQVSESKELRDAIVWDVNNTDRYCRVKIQGSNEYIKAWYNTNFERTPQWLKPGNAVRITTPAGNRGRIEVAGHGFLLPTATAGGSVTPPDPDLADTILTGMTIIPTGGVGMQVYVNAGTYRIDEVVYTLGATTLEMDDATFEMDMPIVLMDEGVGVIVALDAAPANNFRVDLLYIGIDGVIHVVKGAERVSDPVKPTIPTEDQSTHLELGWVFIYPGMTTVETQYINGVWIDPEPTYIYPEPDGVNCECDAGSGDSINHTYYFRDQYHRNFTATYSLKFNTVGFVNMGTYLEYNGIPIDGGQTTYYTFYGSSFNLKVKAPPHELYLQMPSVVPDTVWGIYEENYGLQMYLNTNVIHTTGCVEEEEE